MKHLYSTFRALFSVIIFAVVFLQGHYMQSQTTLSAGDIIFTSFDSNPSPSAGDEFSFVLLVPISAGTVISFTDRGYTGSGWVNAGSTESTSTWTSGSALPFGTEIKIKGLTATLASDSSVNGTVVLTEGSSANGISLSNVGDQVIAFQGGGGSVTGGGVTFIAGINFFNCGAGTSAAAWNDVPCSIGPNASRMPPGLVSGFSAFYTGGNSPQSGKFNCTGSPFTIAAQIRTAVMNDANWILTFSPSPSVTVPSECFNAPPAPAITVHPPNRTICAGGNTTFPVSATNATSYQWQVNTGSGFTNITNGGVYSGATSATLSITGATPGMNGYQYRVVVTGSSSVNSNSATLTVSSVSTSGSQINVSCNGGSNGTATVTPSGGIGPYTYSWSPSGGTSAIATGLSAGSYTVTITDVIGCQVTRNYTITQPPAFNASISSQTNIACNGGATGSATVTASGGTGPYTYSWSPSGGTSATATGLSAGVYTVTVTDANGCESTTQATITQPSAFNTSISSQTNIACNGGATGSATVTATGGTGPYTYSWSPSGGTSATATGLTAGVYTVTVTDSNGCESTAQATITQPAAFNTSISSQTNIACNGGATGSATVTASGGTGPYTYSWAPSGGTAATATGLSAGVYTVTVTDSNGCESTAQATITQPAAFNTSISSQTNIACNGGATGSATVTASGGTGPYTYSWSPSGGTSATATGLSAGVYTVTVTDANGCVSTAQATITQPPAFNANITAQTNIACNGGATGSATVTASGGAGSYTYSWSPSGGTAATATGLTAGVYTVTVTDANGCESTAQATITQPTALNANITAQTNIACNGGATGSATVTASGGAGSYTYSWSPSGGTSATATGLSAGTYTVTVTDANGCESTAQATITQPTALNANITAQTNIACNGGATGSATVTASGGAGFYTYSWSPSGGTSATATGLSAGVYTVTVTDANGCESTAQATITQPTALNANITAQTNITCNGGATGSATVTASGGTGSYTYSWSPSGGTAATATGLSAGVYTVTVTDANGCESTAQATITQPTALNANITAQTNIACNGGATGSATVTASGGAGSYTYSWSPSGGTAATATGLSAGTYTVTVTDANGCESTAQATITQPTALNASITAQTNIACNGGSTGSATVTASGGTGSYTYSWSPSGGTAATATGLTAGVYTVTVTDANGCEATQQLIITVEDNQNPEITCISNQTAASALDACTYTHSGTSWDATATDNCSVTSIAYVLSGATTGNGTSLNGVTFNPGVTTVTWTATDSSGNTDVCNFTVTVEDNQNPEITCVNNQTVDITLDQCTYTHSGTSWDATATDNCSVASIAYVLSGATTGNGTSLDGVAFNLGVTTVTWTVTDGSDNTDVCNFTVTVEDDQNPGITCVSNQTVDTDLDQCTYTHSGTAWDATATDNCSVASIAYVLSGATTGNGTSLDGVVFNLGVTTVTWTVTDGSGNTDVCNFTVTVEDNQLPVAVCAEPFTIALDISGEAFISVNDIDSGSFDNCGVSEVTINKFSFDCSDLGDNEIILTVTDTYGNVSTCTVIVTIVDVLPPALDCPEDMIIQIDENSTTYVLPDYFTEGLAVAADNCTDPVTEFTQSPLPGTLLPVGTHTVTLTATDAWGNTDSCSFELTVDDALTINLPEWKALTMYPNPAELNVTISNPMGITIRMVSIYDQNGRLVNEIAPLHPNGDVQFNVEKLPSAVYMVRIVGENGNETVKLLSKK